MKFKLHNRRYTGSKKKLSPWIKEIIKDNCNDNESFADIFAGTASITESNLDSFSNFIINDFLYSNNVIYDAFLNTEKYNKTLIEDLFKQQVNLNSENIDHNYFSLNYGKKFFSQEDAKIIGKIRENLKIIENQITKREYSILLASLIYSVDKAANTVGHYDAYIKNKKIIKKFNFNLIEPIQHSKSIKIYREDANSLVRRINADVVYIDPPYNSRQYSRFYHLLENLVKWDKQELSGVAMKPKPENMSDYCRNNANIVFKDLIENLKCKHIIVSYNNTYQSKSSSSENKITLDEIREILNGKGKTIEQSKAYNHFNAGKTSFDDHKEFVFYTKVR